MNRPAWQRRAILAAKVALAVALLAWLGLSGRLEWRRLGSVATDPRLAVLLALTVGALVLPAVRWWWLLRIQGLAEPLRKVVRLTWAGYFVALVMPGAASGEVAKSYLILRRRTEARARAFSTVLADRFLGMQSLFFLGAVTAGVLVWRGDSERMPTSLALVLLAVLAAMTLGLAALLWAPTRRQLFRVMPGAWRLAWEQSFVAYRRGWRGLLGCFGLSLLSGVLTVASLLVAGRMLGDAASWAECFLAQPLVAVANCVPLTPGGIGVAESASSELFARMGTSHGAEMMLLTRICTAVVSLPGMLGLLLPQAPLSEPDEAVAATATVALTGPRAIAKSTAAAPADAPLLEPTA